MCTLGCFLYVSTHSTFNLVHSMWQFEPSIVILMRVCKGTLIYGSSSEKDIILCVRNITVITTPNWFVL